MRTLFAGLTLLGGLALCAMGCATIDTQSYEGFAETTHELLSNAQDTDHRVHLVHQRYRVTSAPDDALTTNSFQVVSGDTDAELVEALAIRTAALDVLGCYADLVGAMADPRRRGEIAKLVQELEPTVEQFEEVSGIGEAGRATQLAAAAAEARRNIPKERPGRVRDVLAGLAFVTKQTLGVQFGARTTKVLGVAVGTAALHHVTEKRRNRLIEVMQNSQADLENLSSIVGRGNEAIRTASSLMIEQIVVRSNAVRPPYHAPNRIAFDADIAALLEEKNTIMDSLDSVATTMKHLPTAHAELIALLQKKPTGKESLRTLRKEAERIEKDYRE